jgi:glycosyltransferase involved in cell wall biosynthesis
MSVAVEGTDAGRAAVGDEPRRSVGRRGRRTVDGRHRQTSRALRIAMIGTRGVPARYGGFETAIEEIGRRLVSNGHEVTVYCRRDRHAPAVARDHLGMTRVTLPALHMRTAETLTHSALSSLHFLLTRRHDVAFLFNSANAVFLPLLHARDVPVAVHVDGLEWRRSKWAGVGRHYYRVAEALAVRWADALIADAPGVAEYYAVEFAASTEQISYGAPVLSGLPADLLAPLGLLPGRFHLVVARFVPENQVDLVVRGYRASRARDPLVVVGGAPYRDRHTAAVVAAGQADTRVRLVGPVWDQAQLNQLYAHARLCLHGHSVGGTNPSLLRAMGAGTAVGAYDVRYNRDVVGGGGWFFGDEAGVARLIEAAERDPEAVRAYGRSLQDRVAARYSWDDVVDGYEALAVRLAEGFSRRGEASGGRRNPPTPRPLAPFPDRTRHGR